jgi:hypothetical protein
MSEETGREIPDTLRAIRDGQREVIAHVTARHALGEEQMRKSRATIEESVF